MCSKINKPVKIKLRCLKFQNGFNKDDIFGQFLNDYFNPPILHSAPANTLFWLLSFLEVANFKAALCASIRKLGPENGLKCKKYFERKLKIKSTFYHFKGCPKIKRILILPKKKHGTFTDNIDAELVDFSGDGRTSVVIVSE